jgi:hypothetical protein
VNLSKSGRHVTHSAFLFLMTCPVDLHMRGTYGRPTTRHEKTPSRKRGSIANRRGIEVRSTELRKLTRKEHATDLYAAETERMQVK